MTATDLGAPASPMVKIAAELAWLRNHPQFEERPATLREFLGPDYLNVRAKIRKRIVHELTEIMGEDVSGERPTKYQLAMITGGIGIGKTTIASIVLPYLCHWVLCLKDPQDFFELLPGSRIAFMQMSTSEKQALEVVFGDIKARIQHSPWFQKYPYDPTFKNQIRFEQKDIWIIPGDSTETTFEGYNILGGILDEADSHKVTLTKDYAEQGYNTIDARIASRFQERGFLLVIGQMKSSEGFAARKFAEFSERADAYAVRLSIWDAMGEQFYGDRYGRDADGNIETFCYDAKRKQIVPSGIAALIGRDNYLKIPAVYKRQFENDPEKALRDLAGMPPAVGDPFISLVSKIESARDRWVEHHDGLPSPVRPDGRIEPWFVARDSLRRVAHIDLAYSAAGDALGFAMGHVSHVIEIDGEHKPYIVIDMLMRIKALPGSEIFLADVRHRVYALKDDLRFRLIKVTMDGFESTDTLQQLQKRRYETELVSVDRQVLPYHDLREALYEDRIEFPPYICDVRTDVGSHPEEILVKELTLLVDNGKKIDHPVNGSKDVADAVAGVTFTLMGDRRYRRKVVNLEQVRDQRLATAGGGGSPDHPAFRGDFSGSAPLPPSSWRT